MLWYFETNKFQQINVQWTHKKLFLTYINFSNGFWFVSLPLPKIRPGRVLKFNFFLQINFPICFAPFIKISLLLSTQ